MITIESYKSVSRWQSELLESRSFSADSEGKEKALAHAEQEALKEEVQSVILIAPLGAVFPLYTKEQ